MLVTIFRCAAGRLHSTWKHSLLLSRNCGNYSFSIYHVIFRQLPLNSLLSPTSSCIIWISPLAAFSHTLVSHLHVFCIFILLTAIFSHFITSYYSFIFIPASYFHIPTFYPHSLQFCPHTPAHIFTAIFIAILSTSTHLTAILSHLTAISLHLA